MVDYTGLSCPDDPTRTADYGYFANEREDEIERPQLLEYEIIDRIVDTLKGKSWRAFGYNDECWEELICSDRLCDKYRDLAIAFLKDDQDKLREIGAYLRKHVTKHANEWLLEADEYELEQEGFIEPLI